MTKRYLEFINNKKQKYMKFLKKLTPFTLPFLLAACGNDDLDPSYIHVPNSYEFTSLTDPSAPSSVDYREATTRLALIKELEYVISSYTLQAYGEANGRDAVIDLLNRVYQGGTILDEANNLVVVNLHDDSSTPTPVKGINISETSLTFGNEAFTENTNIKNAVPSDMNDTIQGWFLKIANIATDGDYTSLYTKDGYDYKALIIGYLSVTMPFYQVSNTYLNTSSLTANNTRNDSSTPYTQLEHNWDLAFGYFGTSASAKTQSLESIIASNQGSVSQLNNYVFDMAAATAQRDLDSTLREANFSQLIIEDFLNGRAVISLGEGHELYSNQTTLINNHAESILYNWEKALAATLIYHIKNTIINRYIPTKYDYHWAMMTIYAQAIPMDPNALLAPEVIADLIKTKVDATDINKQTKYLATLFNAEQSIQQTYSFSESDVASWR